VQRSVIILLDTTDGRPTYFASIYHIEFIARTETQLLHWASAVPAGRAYRKRSGHDGRTTILRGARATTRGKAAQLAMPLSHPRVCWTRPRLVHLSPR